MSVWKTNCVMYVLLTRQAVSWVVMLRSYIQIVKFKYTYCYKTVCKNFLILPSKPTSLLFPTSYSWIAFFRLTCVIELVTSNLLCLFRICLLKMNWRPYAVVKFVNNQISVVPLKWLFKENTGELFCYWSASRQRIISLEMPNPNWPVWSVLEILGRRGLCFQSICLVSFFF